MPILTDKHCETKVRNRTKFYDEGPGAIKNFYVDVLPSGVATFCFKKPYVRIGVYRPADHLEAFTVKEARIAAREIQTRIDRGEDVSAKAKRDQAAFKERQGMTIDKLAALYIEHIKIPVPKCGKLLPRVETWANVESHLRRLVSPRIGRMLVGDVKRSDIAELADDIVEGKFGKASRNNARHMCMAVSAMFKFAIKKEFIATSPAILLGEWTNKKKWGKKPAKRNLRAIEIKQLWHGLDNEELPHDRRTRLGLKFELVTMLRGGEFLSLRKDEVIDLDGTHPHLHIPVERVKNRKHDLKHPLSPLAVEIIREALKDNKTDYVFATPPLIGGALINKPLSNKATASALRDRKDKGDAPGLCTLLGIKKFTPHDLRRTGATILRRIANPKTNGITMAMISICLDHTVKREDGGGAFVTSEHYVDAEDAELAEKREVLALIDKELRHIIGKPPANNSGEQPKLAIAA